ncbi:hypothetical protein N7509_011281 [Penicillium cosmopolitanum]|uniref:CFEM domain-containing protein n=1 Tax=Penicillium cosmopolitanum TaxID=1131564 RepID=A0A9W9VT67_9EURO|nr:uncharacterized protein N7509_011281 [Penicillium cosmopolitanum]KAJ5388740.1 hypothetical protein N7509_011281 [Penicillium cosmopolitanum]
MQFSHALIALVAASLANAQLPDVPSCSLNCFVSALTTDGCSALTDFACHCQKTSLVSNITPCVQKACDVADQISVSNAVVAQCKSAGHPIVVPPIETTTSKTSATSESSATETSSGSKTTATGTGSGSSSASATETGSATNTGSATGTGATTAGTSTPLASKTSGGSGGSGAATTSPAFNGASGVKGNMAGVAAIAAAAAYIL